MTRPRGSHDALGVAPLLRTAVGTGDFTAFAERLSDDAVLDSSSERGRRRVRGREAIAAHLSEPGRGEVVDWDAREWVSGAAISFEWRGDNSVDRRRWYLRLSGDEVVALYSYAARPRTEPAAGAQIPPAVLEGLGSGARREPLAHGGNSGAALERVVLADGSQLIAKRVGPGADWLGRVTRDRGRTALLWEAGAFARMPASLDHGIEAVLADGDGWWVVMRDLSATFLGDERRLSRAESRRILDAAAAMHAAFAGTSPAKAAWEAFADSVPEDVATEVLCAVRDPAPLAAALERAGPRTLLHGDLRDDNLGLADDRVVLLDWDLATAGTPTVEFAWYLCHDAWRIDASHDELEADFRAAESSQLNDDEIELGMLSGLVQYGWIFGHSGRVHPDPAEAAWARAELEWWIPRTRTALERSGGMPR